LLEGIRGPSTDGAVDELTAMAAAACVLLGRISDMAGTAGVATSTIVSLVNPSPGSIDA
jgi:hypothetical protein